MSFFELLDARAKKTLLCVGLDPRTKTAAAARDECIALIEATAPYTAAYKPNAAFFEVFGQEGWNALQQVIAAVPKHIPVILDAKRGDIGATSEAYANSAFKHLKAHAITAAPYMGSDSVGPFLKDSTKGVFVLCKTSNPGSNELQTMQLANGKTVYEQVATLAETKWNSQGNLGLVVGATDPEAIRRVRAAAPSLWFLVPGVGTQGGDLGQSLVAGLREDQSGMLINVSRAVAGAKNPAVAAKNLMTEINDVRFGGAQSGNLAASLVRSKCVRFGEFKLKSGLISPIYIDLRRLVTYPQIMAIVAKEYAKVLSKYKFDRLVGLPYAALPIAQAISLEMKRPMIYPRKEAKQYGTKVAIEGEYNAGERVLILDDLVTTGETKIEAIDKLKAAGLEIAGIVVLIDREMGATKFLGKHGYRFEAVTNLTKLLVEWKKSGDITNPQLTAVKKFMASESKL